MLSTPKILPVIHVVDVPQAMRNAEMAYEEGADGVFVIHMDGLDEDLEMVAVHLKGRWPDRFVGANYLSRGPVSALKRNLALDLDATWTDRPGVSSHGATAHGEQVQALLTQSPAHLFFGSVAFKYQAVDPDPGLAALNALGLGMIPTTSGEATGMAPPVDKLVAIRGRIGMQALALASGVTPENVGTLAPYLTHLLVSTGISEDFHNFDRSKLRDLVARVRAGAAPGPA